MDKFRVNRAVIIIFSLTYHESAFIRPYFLFFQTRLQLESVIIFKLIFFFYGVSDYFFYDPDVS